MTNKICTPKKKGF